MRVCVRAGPQGGGGGGAGLTGRWSGGRCSAGSADDSEDAGIVHLEAPQRVVQVVHRRRLQAAGDVPQALQPLPRHLPVLQVRQLPQPERVILRAQHSEPVVGACPTTTFISALHQDGRMCQFRPVHVTAEQQSDDIRLQVIQITRVMTYDLREKGPMPGLGWAG